MFKIASIEQIKNVNFKYKQVLKDLAAYDAGELNIEDEVIQMIKELSDTQKIL